MSRLWSLAVDLPQSVADQAMGLLPEGALSQTAFKCRLDDRVDDPLWTVQGLYKDEPEANDFKLELSILSASRQHGDYPLKLELVPATGWTLKNQESYAPIRVGRIVIHSGREAGVVAMHEKGLLLPTSAAFGTGEHPTTFGCLRALQRPHVLKRGMRVLDVGAGSGVLAFAAAKLSPIKAIASDNDAESVDVLRINTRANGLSPYVKAGKAEGFRHRAIGQGRPYDIILSNIFANPLAKLAPAMKRHLKPGGRVILAGFLKDDANRVRNAYATQGIYQEHRQDIGPWVILTLRRPHRPGKV
jgi:ribosomal protein L11 methyltransferase